MVQTQCLSERKTFRIRGTFLFKKKLFRVFRSSRQSCDQFERALVIFRYLCESLTILQSFMKEIHPWYFIRIFLSYFFIVYLCICPWILALLLVFNWIIQVVEFIARAMPYPYSLGMNPLLFFDNPSNYWFF